MGSHSGEGLLRERHEIEVAVKKWIPGQIDDGLLADARVAAGDDNRLAVHSDV